MGTQDEATPLLSERRSFRERTGTLVGKSAKRRTADILTATAQRTGDDAKTARMADVIAELEKDESHNSLWMGFAILSIFNHFVGGMLSMHFLEGWSFVDSFYFVIVVTTTVGYGDMAPKTVLGKLYMCYYVLAAVSIISTCLAYAVGLLIDRQEELLMATLIGEADDEDAESGVVQSAPDVGGSPGRSREEVVADWLASSRYFSWISDYRWLADLSWLGDYSEVGVTLLIFIFICACGVWVFMTYEHLSFVDAVYVTCVSATTVGFGDIDPTRNVTKGIMSIWLVLATLTLAKLITDQSDAFVRSRQRAVTRRLLSAQLDRRAIREMDENGDGKVDVGEFLAQMLVSMDKVKQSDIDDCMRRFKELDSDGSGFVDLLDLPEGVPR